MVLLILYVKYGDRAVAVESHCLSSNEVGKMLEICEKFTCVPAALLQLTPQNGTLAM
jgi:hypothetical protein